ncbi:DUF4328 domain-containing protein [Streptomyces sp. NK08204]|uniref:DUF4328 domain-containing protein n=1 Tax=Streptomyces sp. NK08204 TaxID=2873260 RepID=UPI001CEDCAF8|nr:DUF4328 domain-containing protein [Streptomyces sp. NK08204]
MPGSTAKAPWFLARCTQLAVGAAAGADLVRGLRVRAHLLDPSASSAAWSVRVYLYVMTVAIVLFLTWFARCRRNAELLCAQKLPGSPSWAVLAWLIPVFNLWVPRGLVQDVHRASAPVGTDTRRSDTMVNVWWSAWIGHGVLPLAGRFGGGTSLPLLVAVQALGLLAAALAVALIERITKLQAAGLRSMAAPSALADLPHTA